MTKDLDSRALNRLVDLALSDPSDAQVHALLEHSMPGEPSAMAERTRRRATALSKRDRQQSAFILEARDKVILLLYGSRAPKGWYRGWSDGSSTRIGPKRSAGVGGLLMDPSNRIVKRISRFVGNLDAFESEIAALEAVLRAALTYAAERIRVHTDCKALVQLWLQQRDDSRLDAIRDLTGRFLSVDIRSIPRQHNRSANVLARKAALKGP